MSEINSQALREAAEQAMHDDWGFDADLFHELVTPSIVLELLDERERNQQYIKSRDQENEDIALTVGKLRVELEAEEKTSAARLEALDRTHKMFQREQCRAEAAEKRIAELEAREVQLPTRYDLRYGHPINADERHVMIPKENGSWLYLIDLEHALRVAGIRIKGA
ncbi:TPA: ead/Ea22-like family protein [Escherichia coli]|nr:ead/Ea22-like family protein [Escherichia coli]NZA51045.1 ead/Ea22-like family protein [Escherichia coli]RCQ75045.1 ead/Ea22-like family protein [Escherichia coli]HAH2585496.1 ead/Ea22-like family protein [Escherichia coli]HAN7266995.1 ead/Ea22-like family protein [Escherichia coli]HCH0487195.1 ead/Ea22-like family protein [Escherichia coli]